MNLLEHLMEAARHLKEASRLAVDWRVRDAAAGAGTCANCAAHLQKKIAVGEERTQAEVTFEKRDTSPVIREP